MLGIARGLPNDDERIARKYVYFWMMMLHISIVFFLKYNNYLYCQKVNRPKLTRLRFEMKGLRRVIMRACYLVVLYGVTVKRRHLH